MLRPTFDAILRAALQAADPALAVTRHVARDADALRIGEARIALGEIDRITLIAAGKAAWPMALAALPVVADRLRGGVVVTKHGHLPPDARARMPDTVTLIEAGHPVPDADSVRGGGAIRAALPGLGARDLVLVCVSGGASALAVAPHEGVTLRALRTVNEALLRSGADITEMNAVRGRLDALKAGGLVRLAQPARVAGLILSDVVGDSLDVIASGLTREPRAHNVLIASNSLACAAAAEAARERGFAAHVVTTALSGEAREAAVRIAADLDAAPPRSALIYGGETTVTLRGSGRGGRNQELALAAALALDGRPGRLIGSFGTDGTDGPTDAAGAVADGQTLARAAALGWDATAALSNNDSYAFFAPLGDLIVTGPTGTNVADVVVALREG
ncbi:MAG: DUF4147 domain-containing protein [Thermoflexales bacterium]|nr:DUF4147 domain-containing protein [Thermoflexales bacterium]